MIAIIDYGHGNLQSVYKALSLLNFESQITDSIKDIENAHSLIFPGVGAFGDCMQNLDDKGLTEIIKKSIKKPVKNPTIMQVTKIKRALIGSFAKIKKAASPIVEVKTAIKQPKVMFPCKYCVTIIIAPPQPGIAPNRDAIGI